LHAGCREAAENAEVSQPAERAGKRQNRCSLRATGYATGLPAKLPDPSLLVAFGTSWKVSVSVCVDICSSFRLGYGSAMCSLSKTYETK
jgi:hypothetical protein